MTRRPARLAALLIGMAGAHASVAAAIYRCEVNGVKTFVDSPQGCPANTATPLDDGRGRNGPASKAASDAARRPAPPAAPPAATATAAASACPQRFAQDPTGFRECLRAERRMEVRKIADARLAAIGDAVAEFARQPSMLDGHLAIDKKGRPAAWCEGILSDAIAGRNLEVVDDEDSGGPEWISSGATPGRSAAPILDPGFKEWTVDGSKVVQGYVTARWKGSDPVVLSVVAACSDGRDGVMRCNPQRYVGVYVHDSEVPMACIAHFFSRAYWPNWQATMTPIRVRPPADDRKRRGRELR
jgi:hypothetical protein